MDSGTEGGEASCAQYSQEVVTYMKAEGLSAEVFIDQGASHSENFWGKRFDHPMTFLYPAPQAQTHKSHGVQENAIHHNGLKLAGIAVVAYMLYKHFFKSSGATVLPTTNVCRCNCGQKGIQYPVWVPPTVMQQQPLV